MSVFDSLRTPPAFTQLTYEKSGGVVTVKLNRARSYNALSAVLLQELASAFQAVAMDDEIAVAVLTGGGNHAFCAGADVKEYAEEYPKRPRDYWKWMGLFRRMIESILHCGKPVIARINGMAVAGGNELQLACDLAVMAEHTHLGQAGTSVGSVAAGGATQWLPLVVGDRRAREMLMLNERIPARRAYEWGLVNGVAPTVKEKGQWVAQSNDRKVKLAREGKDGFSFDFSLLDEKVAEMADKLKDKFPECLRYTKAHVNQGKEAAWSSTIAHAQDWLSIHFATPEPREGMTAFVEKRTPDYAGFRKKWAEDASPEYLWGAPTLSCGKCGAKPLPAGFEFCGSCGEKLG